MIIRVLRNAVWLGTGETFVKGGLFVATVLIARSAGPAGVGTFSIAYSAAMIAILILALGQQEVLIREVARSHESARSLLSISQVVQARLVKWIAPAAAIAVLFLGDRDLRLALLAFVPYALLRTATVTVGAAFKGLDRMDVEVRARGFEVGIAVALIAIGAAVVWPAWSAGIAFSIGSAVGLLWLLQRSQELAGESRSVTAAAFSHEGFPFMALAVISQLLFHADRFLLAAFGVETAEIGLWGAAGTIAWAMLAIPQLLAVALYPAFSRIAESGGLPRRLGVLSSIGGVAAGLICTVAIRWIAEPLIDITFGAEFESAVALLRQLAWALPGAFALMAMGTAYAAWRRQTVSLWAMLGALALSVTLNIILIPSMGVSGPAVVAPLVYSLAAVVLTVMVAGLSPRRLGSE
jgi:PST family polysaccharide transporter